MNTNSIRERLELKFGIKDTYSTEELNEIESLTINRFDVDDEILKVDFNDLKEFNNLKELTINNCIITNNDMEIISNLEKLSSLILLNCDILEDIKTSLLKSKIQNLVIDNTNIDLDILSEVFWNKISLKNIEIKKEIFINSCEIDVRNCSFDDITYLKVENYDKIVISISQYTKYKDYFKQYPDKLIIFEDNGQFKVGELLNGNL